MNRFRNISRIMDCVTCDKCRLWGKLQILGLGTAIKVLLTSEEDLARRPLSRQELVALINVLHQFCKSVKFAAAELSRDPNEKVSDDAALTALLEIVRPAGGRESLWAGVAALSTCLVATVYLLSKRRRRLTKGAIEED